MKKKLGQMPFSVPCGKCGRNLEITKRQEFPPRNLPREKIHTRIDPTSPSFSLYCSTCGHYTKSVKQAGPEAE
jgi:hypothetical protein